MLSTKINMGITMVQILESMINDKSSPHYKTIKP
jgi:hypothetical protein